MPDHTNQLRSVTLTSLKGWNKTLLLLLLLLSLLSLISLLFYFMLTEKQNRIYVYLYD